MAAVNNKIPIDTKRRVGRPRGFEPGVALDQAVRVFWEKGYAATSLDDLTTALSVSRPSLYATFGNKEQLFAKCLARYASTVGSRAVEAMNAEEHIEDAVRTFFAVLAQQFSLADYPSGCLLDCALTDEPVLPPAAKAALADALAAGRDAIEKRLLRARSDGQLRQDADPAAVGRLITILMHGLAAEARGAKTEGALAPHVDAACQAALLSIRCG
jgi:AcrR family transcriptional regulator